MMTASTSSHVQNSSYTPRLPDPAAKPAAGFGYLCAAVCAAAVVPSLFMPWLTATGPNGRVSSNAFGRLQGVTDIESTWSGDASNLMISGTWAMLAAIAAVVTVFAAMFSFRSRSEASSLTVPAATVVMACCVLCQLLYLDGKTADLRSLTDYRGSVIGNLGNLFGLLGGERQYGDGHTLSTAGLGTGALLGGVAALAGVLSAAATAVRRHGSDLSRMPAAPTPEPAKTVTPTQAGRPAGERESERAERVEPEFPDEVWAEFAGVLKRRHGEVVEGTWAGVQI